MKCPSARRLAAAVSGEDVAAARHAEVCEWCRSQLEDMVAVIEVARRATPPALSPERRATIGAAALAVTEAAPAASAPRSRDAIVAFVAFAAAAAIAAIVWPGRERAPGAGAEVVVSPPPASAPAPAPAPSVAPVIANRVAPGLARDAAPVRAVRPRVVTKVPDGASVIDARDAAPVQVVTGDTAVQIASAKVEVTAHRGVVTMVRVFAGSAEVERDGHRVIVEAGDIWVRPAPPVDPAVPAASLREFEQGWTALRLARYADAIAAFDRAVDPVVAEDASYWAAIASERAGDRADAARRLRDFIARFPTSVRADDARQALARLAP